MRDDRSVRRAPPRRRATGRGCRRSATRGRRRRSSRSSRRPSPCPAPPSRRRSPSRPRGPRPARWRSSRPRRRSAAPPPGRPRQGRRRRVVAATARPRPPAARRRRRARCCRLAGRRPTPCRAHTCTTAATSSVDPGRTTAGVVPRKRPRPVDGVRLRDRRIGQHVGRSHDRPQLVDHPLAARDPVVDEPAGDAHARRDRRQVVVARTTARRRSRSRRARSSPPAYRALKPSISECGNGHGWLAQYAHVVDLDADLLEDLAMHCLFERLARLDEAGETAVHRDRERRVRARATLVRRRARPGR